MILVYLVAYNFLGGLKLSSVGLVLWRNPKFCENSGEGVKRPGCRPGFHLDPLDDLGQALPLFEPQFPLVHKEKAV